MTSGGLEMWVLRTSFQKSDITWPQQPPIGKVLKFNMIFHDSTKINLVSKHQNKAAFKNLDNSEVLLRTADVTFWKLIHETQIFKPPEATRHHNLTKSLTLLPLRADLLCTLHYETSCLYSFSTYIILHNIVR